MHDGNDPKIQKKLPKSSFTFMPHWAKISEKVVSEDFEGFLYRCCDRQLARVALKRCFFDEERKRRVSAHCSINPH